MALFGLGKKNNESASCNCTGEDRMEGQKTTACACNGSLELSGTDTGSSSSATGLHSVKVLGSGCKSCHMLLVNTNEALKKKGVPFEAEYVTDMAVIASYGIMSTPALVINEKVVSMGKVYSAAEVEKLLSKLGF